MFLSLLRTIFSNGFPIFYLIKKSNFVVTRNLLDDPFLLLQGKVRFSVTSKFQLTTYACIERIRTYISFKVESLILISLLEIF